MLRLSQPQQFLATERQTVEKAYPGDIIGIFDTGELGVGDTVCEKKSPVTFIDFPYSRQNCLPVFLRKAA